MDITIGSYVTLQKNATQITGLVDGIKVTLDGLERISIMDIDYWFYMDQGWLFVVESDEEDEDAEIQPE